jgi:hypothetical protein
MNQASRIRLMVLDATQFKNNEEKEAKILITRKCVSVLIICLFY